MRLSRKKSPLFSLKSGCSPLFIMCALRTMRLSAFWRKISVRRTVGTTPLRMISEKTLPGPTDGSWSASPTRSMRQSDFSALSMACMSVMSTIEHSSMISASQASLSSSSLPKTTVSPSSDIFAPSMRWMVDASMPHSSLMRFAARPVGAARYVSSSSSSYMASTALSMVVFPVPGPPVMTSMRFFAARAIASRCMGAYLMPFAVSRRSISASMFTLPPFFARHMALILSAV